MHFLQRWVTYLASLVLSACVVLPHTSGSKHQEVFAKTTLIPLADGNAAYFLRRCTLDSWGVGSWPCETQSHNALLVRPTDWEPSREIRSIVAPKKQPSSITLPGELYIGYGQATFERPISGTYDTDAEFIGYFPGTGLVWLESKLPSSELLEKTFKYKVIEIYETQKEPFAPRLVLRSGQNVWVFVEKNVTCGDGACFSVNSVLGPSSPELPEYLNRKFMLFHADVGVDRFLEQVLPSRKDGKKSSNARMPPPPGSIFNFDLIKVVPRSRSSPYVEEYKCYSETHHIEKIAWMLLPVPFPVGLKGTEKRYFHSCPKAASNQNTATALNRLESVP